jgi:hypothetical protein
LEELKQDIIARLENTRTNEVVDVVQGHPDLERDRQLMIKELAKAYGKKKQCERPNPRIHPRVRFPAMKPAMEMEGSRATLRAYQISGRV